MEPPYPWRSCCDARHCFSPIPISDRGSHDAAGGLQSTSNGGCTHRREQASQPLQPRRILFSAGGQSGEHRPEEEAAAEAEEEGRVRHSRAIRRADRHKLIADHDFSNGDILSARLLSSRDRPGPSCLESRFWAEGSQTKMKASSSTAPSFPTSRSPLLPALTDESGSAFSALPFDVLARIAGAFSWPNLWSASRVCWSWNQALAPLREAMFFVHWGKKFKHGRGGVTRNLEKALDSFLKGAVRGCAAAMVDAGLLLWDMGRRKEGIYWYRQAAELGDPAGQCNLGLAYLQDPSDTAEAVKWFHRAALAGHVRAQYSLALCLQQGRGVEASALKAAHWYLRAAEGGSVRAMYNLALCYSKGEGMKANLREARRWMKQAAFAGHRKAQFQHGLTLFAEGDGGFALVFLELATRAGETAATQLRDALLQQLSPKLRAYAITYADKWQVKQSSRS